MNHLMSVVMLFIICSIVALTSCGVGRGQTERKITKGRMFELQGRIYRCREVLDLESELDMKEDGRILITPGNEI